MSPRPAGSGATTPRSFRIPDDVWEAAKAEAARREETLSDAMIRFLRRYGRNRTRAQEPRSETPWWLCECVYSCADDPASACSLSGDWHVHPEFGPCPVHPDAPGDQ